MSIDKKIGYLKGLLDGLKFDKDSNEGKVFAAIVDTLDEMGEQIADMDNDLGDAFDMLGDMDEDLSFIIDDMYGDECDCDECSGEYAVVCPECGAEITLCSDELEEGSVECPECGEKLEFDYDDEDEDEQEND